MKRRRERPFLTAEQVAYARDLARKGKQPYGWIARLAKQWGVGRSALIDAISGRSWKDLSTAPVPAGRRVNRKIPYLPGSRRTYGQGEDHSLSVLTAANVTAFRKLTKSGKAKPGWMQRHALKHGVSRATIHAAVYGQTWKSLAESPATPHIKKRKR